MHEGWQFVVATYAVIAGVLGVWFAMMAAKLRRHPRPRPARLEDGER